MKLLVYKAIKSVVMLADFCHSQQKGIIFLIYHRVNNTPQLDIDLPPSLFQRQLDYLARTGRVIAYDHALELLQRGTRFTDNLFVLTFDDGYEDFYTHVFPVLQERHLPAILFVTTGFVEEGIPYPLSVSLAPPARPVTWDMLGKLHASGLVTLGAHTHTHPNLVGKSVDRVEEELLRPLELFHHRLGISVCHFAYPRALWDAHIEQLVQRFYASAVIAEGHKATTEHFNAYRIPRVPVRHSDGWLFALAKMQGWLEAEEKFFSRLRQFSS